MEGLIALLCVFASFCFIFMSIYCGVKKNKKGLFIFLVIALAWHLIALIDLYMLIESYI